MILRDCTRRPSIRLLAVAATAVVVLTGCSPDAAVQDVIAELEHQLARDVAPVLAEHGANEQAFDTYFATVRSVSTGELHVVRGGQTEGGTGGSGPAQIEGIVTIVGPEAGACLAVSVDAEATVRTRRVSGDPADNCADAPS